MPILEKSIYFKIKLLNYFFSLTGIDITRCANVTEKGIKTFLDNVKLKKFVAAHNSESITGKK